MRPILAKSILRPLCGAICAVLGGLAIASLAPCAFAGDATHPIPYVALASSAPAAGSGDVEVELAAAARANGLDPALVHAVAVQESGLHHEARSNRGAMGVMQLTAATARDLGVDPRDMHQNIQGGAAYLRSLLVAFGGDVAKALAAYNAGPGAVLRYDGVPPFAETRNYVTSIMARVAAGAANAVSTPLPTQAARVALQVAANVGARAVQGAQTATEQFAALAAARAEAAAASSNDPIAAILAASRP